MLDMVHRHRFLPHNLHVCLVLFISTPSDAVFDPYRNTHLTNKFRSLPSSLYTRTNFSLESADLKVLPLSTEGWPKCNSQLYQKTKPCGFKAGKIPKFRKVPVHNTCLYWSKKRVTWYQARDRCVGYGGNRELARLSYSGNSRRVFKMIGNYGGYWFGLNDIRHEGRWIYSNHKKIKRLSGGGFWADGEPDDYYEQDCALVSERGGGRWDDADCFDKYGYLCDHVPTYTGIPAIFHPPTAYRHVVGDRMEFRCEVKSEEFKEMTFGMHNTLTGKTAQMKGTMNKNASMTSTFDDVFSDDGEIQCDYVHDIIPRCLVRCNYTFVAMATDEVLPVLDFKCCVNKRCEEQSKAYKIMSSIQPVLLPHEPEVLTDGETYEFTCLTRFSRDDRGQASFGVRRPQPRPENPEYVADRIKDWTVSYRRDGTVSFDTGNKPEGIDVINVTSDYDAYWAGYYMNITFTLGPTLARFHQATILCRSDTPSTRHHRHLKNRNKQAISHQLTVKFLPHAPKLDVYWPGKKGEIYAGDVLHARCSGYVGTLSPALTWTLTSWTGGRTAWTVKYGETVTGLPDWLKVRQMPAVQKCGEGETQWYPTGQCIRFVDEPYTWRDSLAECRDRYGFELVKIHNRSFYHKLRQQTGKEGYFIGLNDIKQEKRYMWWDGAKTPVTDWGEWFEPTVDDYQWRDDPSKLNCVILHQRGVESFNCASRLPFICESWPDYAASSRNFHPDLGPLMELHISISAKKILDGAILQCYANNGLDKRNASLHSANSSAFDFRYGQLAPKLSVAESLGEKMLTLDVNCSAHVGKEGMMTLTLVHQHGTRHRWVVGGKGGIAVTKPSSNVVVRVARDESNDDIGRHIITTMRIHLWTAFHLATIKCYSYDTTDKNVRFTSYLKKSKLYAAHLIDFTNLATIRLDKVEETFDQTFIGQDSLPSDVQEVNPVSSFIILLATVVATVLLLATAASTLEALKRRRRSLRKSSRLESAYAEDAEDDSSDSSSSSEDSTSSDSSDFDIDPLSNDDEDQIEEDDNDGVDDFNFQQHKRGSTIEEGSFTGPIEQSGPKKNITARESSSTSL